MTEDTHSHIHTTHPDMIKRLKRAEGHLKSVVAMLTEGRSCLDIAQQLQAVEKAIASAKKTLIHDHIDHCLENVAQDKSRNVVETIHEFKEISKYL